MTNSEDRPIQAGDWVECVNATDAGELELGARYQVDVVTMGSLGVVNVGLASTGITRHDYRFKRVDGPHPVNASTDSILCYECSEHDGLGDGDMLRVVCAQCPLGEKPEAKYEPGDPRAHAYCKECGVTVVAGTRCEFPLCAKCSERRNPPAKRDPYTEYRLNKSEVMVEKATWDYPQNQWVRHTREADEAALRREAERPRGNPAERKSLAAGHPASWPSNEGED